MNVSMLNSALLAALSVGFNVNAKQHVNQFEQWLPSSAAIEKNVQVNNKVTAGYRTTIDFSDLNQRLLEANESIVISVPLPNGELADFRLMPSITMAPDLAVRYPSIRTFTGVQVDNPDNRGNFDVTPHGFHGFFRLNGSDVFIEPQFLKNVDEYVSYFKRDALVLTDTVQNKRLPPIKKLLHDMPQSRSKYNRVTSASTLRTYRIAVATTGEYTAFHGGTKELGLAAVVTMLNRVNEVYARDLAIKLELVADNDKVIFSNTETDPFANDDSDIDKNTGVLDKAIGNSNYDLGHVVGTGGGGVAGFGVVCNSQAKGEGLTGSPRPTGDPFFIDFVAHEIGHQFRADHTFNGSVGGCEGNREAESSFEPGSASTIMGYAGLCDGQDLQANSDPYFHSRSISQISQFVTNGDGKSCGKTSNLNNVAPVVNAGKDYTIPAFTPFNLTGSATDANKDTLSYSWQQYDLGPVSNGVKEQVDDGKRPLFRTWNPTATPTRTFPKLTSILTNKLDIGEVYPTTTREMNFRLLVRDGKGGVNYDSMKINVIKTNEAFSVTSPTVDSQWNEIKQMVRWNVAQTDKSPISCTSVNISLSTNGGSSFEHKLAENVPNNGQHEVDLPIVESDKGRVKVSCSDNIFFAINKANFSVNNSNGVLKILGVKNEITAKEDVPFELTPAMFNYQGLKASEIKIAAKNSYQIVGGKVQPTLNFNGPLQVDIIGVKNAIESEKFTATVTILPVNDKPVAQNDSVQVNAESTSNVIDVLANDSDVDTGDLLTVSHVDYRGKGTLKIVNNKLEYSPAKGFSGSETVTYTISDKQKATATASLIVNVKASDKVVTPEPATPKKSGGSTSGWVFVLLLIATVRHWRRNGGLK